jgi:hypothetical protein
LTLNPFQVRILAKYLSVVLDQIDFADLRDENNFGDISVRIEMDNQAEDEEDYAVAAPF